MVIFSSNQTNHMRAFFFFLAVCLTVSLSAQEVIITGLMDGTQGGSPRALEIYVSGTVNLTGLRLERSANSNNFPDDQLDLMGSYTDEFIYIVNNSTDFASAFGSAGDFANVTMDQGLLSVNGNDAFRIINISSGIVIDQTGGEEGDNGAVLYEDGYLYRNDNTGPDGGWVAANWVNFLNVLDGQTFAEMGATVPFGTYSTTPPGPSVSAMANGDLTEPATDGGFTVTLSEAAAGPVTVMYTLGGTATVGDDYSDPGSGSVVIPMGMSSADISIEVEDDVDSEPAETIEITLTGVSDATFALGGGATINVFDDEPVSATPIHTVQGSGTSSPMTGQTVSIEGIVVGDFQGGTGVGLGGFFVQEEDADADADPSTSEGVWVFDNSAGIDVNVGDLVQVTGVVEESSDLTQINVTGGGATVNIASTGNTLPTAATLDLPVAQESNYESFEGMLTAVADDTYITETFSVGRFGEFTVSEEERLIQFTECNAPDPVALAAYNDAQDLRKLIVDDGRSGDNAFPIILGNGYEVNATNSIRSGTVVTGLTGVIDERFGSYRMQGTDFTLAGGNERPTAAPAVGGNLTVVGMNVLNYFTTLGSRGADNAAEFDRQEAKIVNAICELDADIIGLAEIENNGYGASGALQTLIDAISAECGITYDFVTAPNSGTDEIQVALIYKTSTVEESGTAASLSTPAAVFSSNRIPVAQTFRIIEAGNASFGQEVTVCVNHWKSKGGSCGAGDDDTGGAGSCDGTRTDAAIAIRDWLSADPTGSGETDQLVIGDLNAYSQEAPITTMINAGFVNTVRDQNGGSSFPCSSVPSYVFRGEWGSLDHALASATLAAKVTGATPWTVNAPEPTALDYDTQFNDPALYADDFYRFSDHDPIVVGMDLGPALPVELLSFTGQEDNGDVLLQWETATEQATDRFEVQRRDANNDFILIGTLAAAGNSSTPQSYSFTDEEPFSGENAYRLRIIYLDGSEAFSDIVTVEIDPTNSLQLIPLSGGQDYRLSGAPLGTEYLLTDARGAQLSKGSVNAETTDINGNGLPTGVYFLMLRTPNGKAHSFKLMLR